MNQQKDIKTLLNASLQGVSNLAKIIQHEDDHFIMTHQLLSSAEAVLYNRFQNSFMDYQLYIYPNVLMIKPENFQSDQQTCYILLCKCFCEKKFVRLQGQIIFQIELSYDGKSENIYFSSFNSHQSVYKIISRYSIKQINIPKKYAVQYQIRTKNSIFTNAVKRKNKQNFSFITTPIEEYKEAMFMENEKFFEVHNNLIIKNPGLLEMSRIYSYNNQIYFFYKKFEAESLSTLLNSGFRFSEIQLCALSFSLISSVKIFRNHNIYHGNINLDNIFYSFTSSPQTALVQSRYVFNDRKDVSTLNSNKYFQMPQVERNFENSQVMRQPSILNDQEIKYELNVNQIDMYSIGVCLYYIMKYQELQTNININLFIVSINFLTKGNPFDFKSLQALLNEQNNKKQDTGSFKTNPSAITSVSLIDLIIKLTDISKNTFYIDRCLHHHWFINMKSKASHLKQKKHFHQNDFPSLNTILEIKEASERDFSQNIINKSSQNQLALSILDEKDEFEAEDEGLELVSFLKQIKLFKFLKPSYYGRKIDENPVSYDE